MAWGFPSWAAACQHVRCCSSSHPALPWCCVKGANGLSTVRNEQCLNALCLSSHHSKNMSAVFKHVPCHERLASTHPCSLCNAASRAYHPWTHVHACVGILCVCVCARARVCVCVWGGVFAMPLEGLTIPSACLRCSNMWRARMAPYHGEKISAGVRKATCVWSESTHLQLLEAPWGFMEACRGL